MTPPSAGRQRVGVDHHAEQRVDQREPVGAGVGARPGDERDVGDVGRELGEDRLARVGGPPHRADHPRGRDRVAGEHLAAALDVRAGDVDLDHRHRRVAGQPAGQRDVLVGVPAGDRDDRARAVLGQPGQVVLDERVDARALQPDRVEHAARRLGHPRRRPSGPGPDHDRLGDDGAECGDVEELVAARVRRPRSRTRSAPGSAASASQPRCVMSTISQCPSIASAPTRSARQPPDVGPAHPVGRRTPARRRTSGRTATGRRRRAPAARRSCRPRCRRPSTPRPRPGPGSRAAGRRRRPPAASPSARRRRRPRRRSARSPPGSTSVTSPAQAGRAVVGGDGDLADERACATSSPNSRPAVAAPMMISTGEPASISRAASGISGAVPYPPPTSTAGRRVGGSGNGLPSGPTRSSTRRRLLDQPAGARAVLGDHELDGAGELVRRRRAVERERAAQHHRRVRRRRPRPRRTDRAGSPRRCPARPR